MSQPEDVDVNEILVDHHLIVGGAQVGQAVHQAVPKGIELRNASTAATSLVKLGNANRSGSNEGSAAPRPLKFI